MRVNLIITDIEGYDGEIILERKSERANIITDLELDMIRLILNCDYGLNLKNNNFKVKVEPLFKIIK